VYTSTPAYLPDPLFDFSEGLVPRLRDVKGKKGGRKDLLDCGRTGAQNSKKS